MLAHVAMETSAPAPTTATTPRSTSGKKSRIGETTGECAAVCCCCPCAVVHLLILAVYRLPAGIWRKKRRKRILSRKKKKKNKTSPKNTDNRRQAAAAASNEVEGSLGSDDVYGRENDAVRWDNEMWRQFYGGGGFWRSESRGD